MAAYLDEPVYSAPLRRSLRFVRYDPAGVRAKLATIPDLVADVQRAVGCARRPVVVLTDRRRARVLDDLRAERIAPTAGVLPPGWGCTTP